MEFQVKITCPFGFEPLSRNMSAYQGLSSQQRTKAYLLRPVSKQ